MVPIRFLLALVGAAFAIVVTSPAAIAQETPVDDDSLGNPVGWPVAVDVLANDGGAGGRVLLVPPDFATSNALVLGFDVPGEGEWHTAHGLVIFTPEYGFTSDPTPVEYTTDGTSRATVTIGFDPDADEPAGPALIVVDDTVDVAGEPDAGGFLTARIDVLANDDAGLSRSFAENDLGLRPIPGPSRFIDWIEEGIAEWFVLESDDGEFLHLEVTVLPGAGRQPRPIVYSVVDPSGRTGSAIVTVRVPGLDDPSVSGLVTDSDGRAVNSACVDLIGERGVETVVVGPIGNFWEPTSSGTIVAARDCSVGRAAFAGRATAPLTGLPAQLGGIVVEDAGAIEGRADGTGEVCVVALDAETGALSAAAETTSGAYRLVIPPGSYLIAFGPDSGGCPLPGSGVTASRWYGGPSQAQALAVDVAAGTVQATIDAPTTSPTTTAAETTTPVSGTLPETGTPTFVTPVIGALSLLGGAALIASARRPRRPARR